MFSYFVLTLAAYNGTDSQIKKQLLMDAIVIIIFTYQTVDRVGIIRKLRINETLKKLSDGSGTWVVDLSNAQRSHKSAKFHGATRHAALATNAEQPRAESGELGAEPVASFSCAV